jgi:hypothetical protein
VLLFEQDDSLFVHLNYRQEQPAPSLLAAQAEFYLPRHSLSEWQQSGDPTMRVTRGSDGEPQLQIP